MLPPTVVLAQATEPKLSAGQLASIASALWNAENRTLSATSLARGPEAALNDEDIPVTVFKNGSPRLAARVYLNGILINQADVASVHYSIYELSNTPDSRAAVTGHTNVALNAADVIYDTLQTDAGASKWNFKFQPDISVNPAFIIAGKNYLVEVKIQPVSGQVVIIRFRCDCI